MFLENNRDMGVKNGMLGTVERTELGRLSVRLDGGKGQVEIDPSKYKAFDHGYATTIHKTQGATVDRSFLLASNTMDRHLTYVGMTRHRDAVEMYAGKDQFLDIQALASRLSRSGAKETTLDYPKTFVERRGLADYNASTLRQQVRGEDRAIGRERWRQILLIRNKDNEIER
ncbi:hypothetical protein [Asticcacaulis taihuensis]|uniref:hypothetical protein n=1 Tax=Asticcacaulis taihuensis TaxID=260084 RepID=UPI003F7B3AFF